MSLAALLALFAVSCGAGNNETPASADPKEIALVRMEPADGESSVPRNRVVRMFFNTTVLPESVTDQSIQVRTGGTFQTRPQGKFLVNGNIVGDLLEVEGFPYGELLRKPLRLTPREARAMLLAIDLVGGQILAGRNQSLESAREKIILQGMSLSFAALSSAALSIAPVSLPLTSTDETGTAGRSPA